MQLTSPRERRQKCCHRPKHAVCHSLLSVMPSQYCALHGRLTGISRTGCWQRGRQKVQTERFFKWKFRQKWHIYDQAIVFQIVMVKRRLFEKRFHNGSFELGWNNARDKRWVDYVCDRGRSLSKHSTNRDVGIGSSEQVFGADLSITFRTCSSETGWNASKTASV